MAIRVLPTLTLLALATGCFAYALVSLQRERDLHAALALLAAAVSLRAFDRSVELLEGS
jgi:hypothetical protein